MGFPKRNADGTPFRDDDEYIAAREAAMEGFKALELEIESLRNQLSACIKEHDLAIARGDEWKRRTRLMWIWMRGFMTQGFGRASDRFLDEHPEAKVWFEGEE